MKKMTEKGVQTRNKIISSSKELFFQKEYSDVTIKEICEKTGFTERSFFTILKILLRFPQRLSTGSIRNGIS